VIGRTVSHYNVVAEIGRGGMGIVYRAVDLKLNREVALKVLPPELVADAERKRRFIQEAQAAAALNHPHIAVVYEIDEADGVTFIAMELLEGEKLRDVLQRERLPLQRTLELATEVAEGLARAHEKGIVHRDLKPANIMRTEEGHAKIIDFGLAKLVEPLEDETSEAETAVKETDPGKVMGTVSYMSPEQARGKKVDHRSDIFTFGIVFHEMLTGHPPFRGESGIETMNAILKEPAPKLGAFGSEVSAEASSDLQRIQDKCLAKDPAERYQTIKDVVVDLRAARRRLESDSVAPVPSPPRRRPMFYAGVGAIALLLLIVALLLVFRPSPEVPTTTGSRPSIAVLFFDNNSRDPSLDWLRTALADMLITGLSQSPQLEVLGTETVYQIFADMNQLDAKITSLEVVQEVRERAGVDTVLLGSFVQAGDTIRISVRLQEAKSGKILNTESVEGIGESSIFPMVDDLTRRVRSNLEIPSTADAAFDLGLNEVTTSSMEAYRFYAEGRDFHLRNMHREAIPFYEKAIGVDPDFAMALRALSSCNWGTVKGYSTSLEYGRRAFELADRLPPRERYFVQGWYHTLKEDTWDSAIQAFQKVLETYPDHLSARFYLAYIFTAYERFEEANKQWDELARRRFPSGPSYGARAQSYAIQGQWEKGLVDLQDFANRHPQWRSGPNYLGALSLFRGELDEAMEWFRTAERSGYLRPSIHGRWLVSVIREDWEQAEAQLGRLRSLDARTWSLDHAVTSLYKGRSREALSSIEEMARAFRSPDPHNGDACNLSAHVLLENDRATETIEQAERARIEGNGNEPGWEGIFWSALAQAKLGNQSEAQKMAEELRLAAEELPTDKEIRRYHHLLGELALSRGEASLAIHELERAQSLLPPKGFSTATLSSRVHHSTFPSGSLSPRPTSRPASRTKPPNGSVKSRKTRPSASGGPSLTSVASTSWAKSTRTATRWKKHASTTGVSMSTGKTATWTASGWRKPRGSSAERRPFVI
jgi:serine/threonine protein kinase/tetratricopeptide (TPR) repeat protein